jgi:hypothetical protein
MALIKLTQMVESKKVDVYVSSEQIVLIGDPLGMGADWAKAHLHLTNGDAFVLESVAEVVARFPTSG